MAETALVRQEAAVVQHGGPVGLDIIMRAAQDPTIDAGKVEKLIALYERMQDRAAEEEFNRAMVACQAEMPRVTKDGKILNKAGQVQSRYATIERIDDVVRPIYQSHGFSISVTCEGFENGKYWFRAVVRHKSGHTDSQYRIPLSLDQSGSKNDTQGMGSTRSYARRYLLCDVFHIITEGEDNDGRGAVAPETVSAAQVGQLIDMANSVSANLPAFCAYLKVNRLEELPATRFQEALNELSRKRKK